MKLSKRNYFTLKNRYLSNSKLSDWIRCPNYFYRKHVLGEIITKETPAMRIGSGVDYWISFGQKKFREKYLKVGKRSEEALAKTCSWIELPASEYETVEKLSRKLETTKAIQELRGYTKQKILQYDMGCGKYFEGICGVPDFFKIKDDVCTIIDLKTSVTINFNKYYYKCVELGYFRQQAMYQTLINRNFGIDKFVSKHIVIEKDPDEIFNCKVFELSQVDIDVQKEMIFVYIEEIIEEDTGKFDPLPVSLDDSIVVGTRDAVNWV